MESAFQTVSKIVNEPSNTFDELRIIATDQKGLNTEDREAIKRGADELEMAQTALVLTYGRLIEAQQKIIALNERLLESNKIGRTQWPIFPKLHCTQSSAGIDNGKR